MLSQIIVNVLEVVADGSSFIRRPTMWCDV